MVLVDVTLERGSGCRRPGQGGGKGKAASRLISVASGSDLFAGPFVSVHLHHALAEDVKGVFFLLRSISSQALSL